MYSRRGGEYSEDLLPDSMGSAIEVMTSVVVFSARVSSRVHALGGHDPIGDRP